MIDLKQIKSSVFQNDYKITKSIFSIAGIQENFLHLKFF